MSEPAEPATDDGHDDASDAEADERSADSTIEPLEIVLCTHYYHPHVGGIEVVAENHARRLAERGHDVTVLTTAVDAPSGRTTRDGYQVVRYGALNPLEERGMPYPLPNPVSCARAARSVVDGSVDVVHVHGLNFLTSLGPLLAAPLDDTSVLLHQHTPFVDYSPVLNLAERVNDRLVGGTVLHYVEHAVGVSENVSAFVESQYGGPVTTLYNGVDTDRFRPDVAPTEDEFLYLGRLTQKKGIDRLLDTVEELADRDTDLTVRIVGGGTEEDDVRAAVESFDIVEYEGFVDFERLPELYSRARALVVPELGGDAFPTLTILEALGSGTPPILPEVQTHAPGLVEDETFVRAGAGAEGLADAMEDLSERDEFAERLSASARSVTVETYDWEQRVDELESIYETVCVGTE